MGPTVGKILCMRIFQNYRKHHAVSLQHLIELLVNAANVCMVYLGTAVQLSMHNKLAPETCARKLHKKLAWKIWRKFITVPCTATGRPVTLHGSCHVPDSFCPGIELCSIACKKLVQEKLVQDWPTHMQVSCTRRLAQVSGTRLLIVCCRHNCIRSSVRIKPGLLSDSCRCYEYTVYVADCWWTADRGVHHSMSRGMCCGRLDAVEPVSLALSPSRSSVSLWFIVSVSRRTALDMRSVVEHIENVQSLYIFKNESPTAGFRSKLLYAESASSFIPSTSSCSLSSRFMSSCTHHLVTLSTLSQSITTSVFHCRLETLLFLPRCALQCKARSWDHMSSVRLSACLSVTLVDCDHIG